MSDTQQSDTPVPSSTPRELPPLETAKRPSGVRWWIDRYPWARPVPGGAGNLPSLEYPAELRRYNLVLEAHEFRRFLARYFATEIWDSDLNLLEYYGWVLPVRKAITRGLIPERTTYDSPEGKVDETFWEEWRYVRYDHQRVRRRRLAKGGTDPGELPKPNDPWFNAASLREQPLDELRPTPWLNVEPHAQVQGGIGVVPPREPATWYPPGLLRSERLWLRPTDFAYWAHLGITTAHPAHPDFSFSITRRSAKRLAPPKLARTVNFALTPGGAADGNREARCFYAIGWGMGGHRPSGALGSGPGQDWLVAGLMHRLRNRCDLPFLMGIAAAEQARSTQESHRVFDGLAERSRELSKIPDLGFPPIHATFYRDAMAHIGYRSLRAKGLTSLQSYQTLQQHLGGKFDYVRKIVSTGGRAIRLDTNMPG